MEESLSSSADAGVITFRLLIFLQQRNVPEHLVSSSVVSTLRDVGYFARRKTSVLN